MNLKILTYSLCRPNWRVIKKNKFRDRKMLYLYNSFFKKHKGQYLASTQEASSFWQGRWGRPSCYGSPPSASCWGQRPVPP